MTMYRVGPAGIPASLKTNMDAVLNKKFGTSTTYAPATWPDNVNLLGPLPEKTASGSVAAITDGADGVPVKNWGVTVDANLSGVSSVVCTQAGKNILPNKTYQRNVTTLRIGTDTLDGTLTFQAGTYTLSVKTALTGATLNYTSGGSTTSISTSTDGDYRKGTFTLSGKTELFFGCYNSGGITSAQVSELQLEVGNSRTTYTPYTAPTTYTASLGRTIYGGSVDVVAGTGTDLYRLITFDGTQSVISGNYGTGGYVQYSCATLGIDPDIDKPLYDLQPGLYVDALTGNYRINSFESGGIKRIRFNDIRLGDTITSKDEWNAYLSQNPVTVAYPLATPETFTFPPITPTPETALGTNNFWADEGDSKVTYRADINMLIASLSGNRGLMMTRPQLEAITEENKEEESPEVTEK